MSILSTYDIISKKRQGLVLAREEISFIVNGFLQKKVNDFQIGAFLMAVFIKGMNEDETYYLTESMAGSGEHLDLKSINAPKIDKHSTGGVGDGVTLCLVPIVSSLGLVVPTMAGRSLGYTGGTIDKLESIPGINTSLEPKSIVKQLQDIGCAIFSQTDHIAAADKYFYSIRDKIACVESPGLIISSILSKKMSESIDGLVLDIKVGSGAFLNSFGEAERFASNVKQVAKRLGIKITQFITDMDQPLGKYVGNSLEMFQAVEILSGKREENTDDIRQLIAEFAMEMLMMGDKFADKRQALEKVNEVISNGKAKEKLKELISYQNGDVSVIDNPSKLPQAQNKLEVLSDEEGFVEMINARGIAECLMLLGGGRTKADNPIDLSAGIILNKKHGQYARSGDILGTLVHNFSSDDQRVVQAAKSFIEAFSFSKGQVKGKNLVIEIVKNGI
ncbi:MAG: thymidine phosphorylase [bacterium]